MDVLNFLIAPPAVKFEKHRLLRLTKSGVNNFGQWGDAMFWTHVGRVGRAVWNRIILPIFGTALRIIGALSLLGVSGTLILLSVYVYPQENEFRHIALHEVGFGLLVALFVFLLFDLRLNRETETIWLRRMELVSQNVFMAVLRKEMPQRLLDEANRLALDSKLVRDSLTVDYTLRDSTVLDPARGELAFVEVAGRLSFRMKNICADTVPVNIILALPNPIHPLLQAVCSVKRVTAYKQGIGEVPLDMERAESKFRQAMALNARTAISYDLGQTDLAPGGAMEIVWEYVMAKECEDTELFQTLYPADGIRLSITDLDTTGRRLVFARSVHRQDVEALAMATTAARKFLTISDYLLPHQGALVWWKTNPDYQPAQDAAGPQSTALAVAGHTPSSV